MPLEIELLIVLFILYGLWYHPNSKYIKPVEIGQFAYYKNTKYDISPPQNLLYKSARPLFD